VFFAPPCFARPPLPWMSMLALSVTPMAWKAWLIS
jgi:hypothetical protein